jgi:hypothetical protein
MEETTAYAATTADKEQTVLNVACGAAQLRADLCAELWDKASASVATGRSARAVARAAHAKVLHANMPPGWVPVTEVLDEVDNDESDDFTEFDDEEDASDVSKEQRALVASFETARRDRAAQ